MRALALVLLLALLPGCGHRRPIRPLLQGGPRVAVTQALAGAPGDADRKACRHAEEARHRLARRECGRDRECRALEDSLHRVYMRNCRTSAHDDLVVTWIGDSLVFDAVTVGYGTYGSPGGWYVRGLLNTVVNSPYDEWEFRIEAAPYGGVPSGLVVPWLANPYVDDRLVDLPGSWVGPERCRVAVPASSIAAGDSITWWLDVDRIDDAGQDAGAIEEYADVLHRP